MSGKMSVENTREFLFTTQDFQLVSKLIYQRAGISLSESKQELVYSRVARRLRATGIKTFAEYLERLQRGDAAEWEEFTNSLTTNLTSFFREAHHFQVLTEHLRKLGKTRPIELWCSACSTGEEAYSMAMTAVDAFAGFDNPVRIVASDLDTKVLEAARIGRYRLESVAKIPAQQVDKYFVRGKGADDGYVQVRPELQKMIIFRRVNLLDTIWPIREQLDAIFCRNVMIYFDKPTQLAILKKFAPLLRSDGLLFAGHSENFYHADAYFKLRANTVYELAAKPKTASA
jgi:chemotaxis protein methyltransferase CheR